MTKYKAVIKFLEEPMKIIRWFTKNFDNEVGALGIGELKDGIMIIERLVFPEQIVNGVHVHFKPKDWGPIIRELSEEEIGKILFYWHKHPGDAKASQGDEDDTFDAFMPEKNCPRPYFGFLQTAENYNGDFEYEARIELRDPIWTTIEDVEIMTDDDYGVEEECKKIIADRITFGNADASDQPGTKKGKKTKQSKIIKENVEEFNAIIDYNSGSLPTFEVVKKNGNIKLTVSDYFEDWIVDILNDDLVSKWVKKFKKRIGDGRITFDIQPTRKKINNLYSHFYILEQELVVTPSSDENLEKTINKNDIYTEEDDISNFNKGKSSLGNNYQASYW